MRRRNTPRRNTPSPLVVMISMGLLVSLVALVLWPKPSKTKTASLKTKSAMHAAKTQRSQDTQRAPAAAPQPQASSSGKAIKAFSGEIRGPLPHSMRRKLDRESAKFLSALAARLLIWKLDLRRDLRRKDHIKVLYKPVDNQSKFQVLAMKYQSRKYRKTFHYYRYKEAGRKYAAFYNERGQEIEIKLRNAPLRTYEQVTSILKMRRKHKGVDFKAPTGTKIYLPYRSRVIRGTWNFRYNGNCVEVEFLDGPRPGTRALFLHLQKLMPVAKKGRVLNAGTVIGLVGNTGRSTAPHLHYQLQTRNGRRIFDPYNFHKTYTRSLPASHQAAFQQHRRRLDQTLQALTQ